MAIFSFQNFSKVILLSAISLIPVLSQAAGGIVLGGTRIVYPAGQKQSSISVHNTSDKTRYMVQSWVEDADGKKSNDYIVTPPLYVSNPGKENLLRLIYAGPDLPTDRESIYYLTTKAIPAIDRSKTDNKNVLVLAASTRIKIFVRPSGLSPAVDKAPSLLTFTRHGKEITVNNPTPYYITMVKVKADNRPLNSLMIAPMGSKNIELSSASISSLTFKTMNDYGGFSEEYHHDF